MRNADDDENFAKQSCSNRLTCVLFSGSQAALLAKKTVTECPECCKDQTESPPSDHKCHSFVWSNDHLFSSPHSRVFGRCNLSVRG